MYLVMCREGETALTPTGRRVVILHRAKQDPKAVTVQFLDTGDKMDIRPRHLRHVHDERFVGDSVINIDNRTAIENVLKARNPQDY